MFDLQTSGLLLSRVTKLWKSTVRM